MRLQTLVGRHSVTEPRGVTAHPLESEVVVSGTVVAIWTASSGGGLRGALPPATTSAPASSAIAPAPAMITCRVCDGPSVTTWSRSTAPVPYLGSAPPSG